MKTGKRRALIHVDLLNDFISGSLPVPRGEEVIGLANELTEDALREGDVVVFLADCHPRETKHFEKWPPHCMKGTEGQRFHPDLLVPIGSFIVYKGTGHKDDGYSGFDKENVEIYLVTIDGLLLLDFSNLEKLLDNLEVGSNDIDGLATNYCDKATALDSAHLGYRTRLILDACRGIPYPPEHPDSEENALREMKAVGVEIVDSKQALTP